MSHALVLLAAIVSARLGLVYSEATREALIRTGAGLAAGLVRALFLWPTAFLLEHVLRRLRASGTRFRHLALGVLAVGVYANSSMEVLSRLGVVSLDSPVPSAIQAATVACQLLVVPLFVLWCVLWLSQRSRRSL